MSTSSETADEFVRLMIEGTEVVARISGVAAKNIAVALYTVMKNKQQTKGKTRLNNMLKTEKELKIFSVKREDLKIFCREAKSYGILYCGLISRRNRNLDGMVDIMVRAEDAPRVNRIIERYNLATFDKAMIQREIEKERATNNRNDLNIELDKKDIDDAMVEDILKKPIIAEKQIVTNPNSAKTEKNPPSEHSLKNKNNFEGVTNSVKKESVRKKLEEIKAEKKVDTKLKDVQVTKSKNTKKTQRRNEKVSVRKSRKKERGR